MRRARRRGMAAVLAATATVGAVGWAAVTAGGAPPAGGISLAPLGTYATGLVDDETSAETAVVLGDRLYVTNAEDNSLDIVDVSDPAAPTRIDRIDLSPWGAGPNSVDARRGLIAVAVEADPATDPGAVVFLTPAGDFVRAVTVGALPDMLVFTPDGDDVVVANEGEAEGYLPGQANPEGSVSIIPTRTLARRAPAVRTVDFAAFNAGGPRHGSLPQGVRLNGGPLGATVAQDLEPEYVAIDQGGATATVTLQEANAIARIDLRKARVISIHALGTKDHSLAANALDPSDEDGAIAIGTWPVRGMYMPDSIAAFRVRGTQYLITANEGDGREFDGLEDETRVEDLTLDPSVFPDAAALQAEGALGRLTVSTTDGVGPNGHTALHAFGARSASIWTTSGRLLWDSGDAIERRVALEAPDVFNASNDNNDFDNRSDNKGPEPEAVAVGTVDGRTYAFVGLERIGGVMVFDITDPRRPTLVQWANNRDYALEPNTQTQDSGPEIIRFLPAATSPTGAPAIMVANEVSGTVTFYGIRPS